MNEQLSVVVDPAHKSKHLYSLGWVPGFSCGDEVA